MRLLYFTDTHICSVKPDNRRDDFLQAMEAKLSEIVELCRLLSIDYVIHGGDLFDQPNPDQRSLDLLGGFLDRLELPVYCVAGNHDLIDQRLDSLEGTALGSLARLECVHLLQPSEMVYLSNNNLVLQLSGQHYYRGIDGRDGGKVYMVNKKSCDLAVHVVHGMLLPRAFSEKVPCTLISSVTATEADFTLGAHAHLGYHVTRDGKHFLNPGALARVTNLSRERIRTPQVLYLDFTSANYNYRFIPLGAARPGNEVMEENAGIGKG